LTEPIKGSAYHKNGVTIHVHYVEDGIVYFQKFGRGVEVQPFFDDLWRKPIAAFMAAVKDAELELPHEDPGPPSLYDQHSSEGQP
jgi:hypothetical protein